MHFTDQWKCGSCGWENGFVRKRCRHCGKSKRTEKVRPTGIPALHATGQGAGQSCPAPSKAAINFDHVELSPTWQILLNAGSEVPA